LRFAPETVGSADAVLSIVSSRAGAEVVLSGSSVAAPPAPPPATEPDAGTDPSTGPGDGTSPGSTAPGVTPGDDSGTDDGTLPVTGGAPLLASVAVALALIGAGAVLVGVRRRVG
jgi:LPXTG-motif cell wall-anchored protein